MAKEINLPVETEPPQTRPGSCPIHKDVTEFVRIPGTTAYVCPYPAKDHGEVEHLIDRPPGRMRPREGHR